MEMSLEEGKRKKMASDLFVTACDMRKNSSYKTQENKRLSP
jgi:hypothetical protein